MGKGRRTRRRLCEVGLAIAASEGFEAVTLQRLAQIAEMSRTGAFAAFGSIAAIRREIVLTGLEYWRDEILQSAQRFTGMPSIWEAWSRWLEHATTLPLFLELLPGIAEADKAHPEAELRNEVVKHWRRWERFVISAVKAAADADELSMPVNGEQLHQELLRLAGSLAWLSRMKGTEEALRQTAVSMFGRIGAPLRTPLEKRTLDSVLRDDLGRVIGGRPLLLNVDEFGGIRGLQPWVPRQRVNAFDF